MPLTEKEKNSISDAIRKDTDAIEERLRKEFKSDITRARIMQGNVDMDQMFRAFILRKLAGLEFFQQHLGKQNVKILKELHGVQNNQSDTPSLDDRSVPDENSVRELRPHREDNAPEA